LPASSIQLARLTDVGVLEGAAVVAVVVVTVFAPEVAVELTDFDTDVSRLLEPCGEELDPDAAVVRAVGFAEPAEPAIAPRMARVAEALASPAIRRARRAGCRRRGTPPLRRGRAAVGVA
jgi:hypothetical protein